MPHAHTDTDTHAAVVRTLQSSAHLLAQPQLEQEQLLHPEEQAEAQEEQPQGSEV